MSSSLSRNHLYCGGMSTATRLARVQAELAIVQTQIDNTLSRGAASYSTDIDSVNGHDLGKLYARERELLNEEQRLTRTSRFGNIGFKRVPG